jgi:hypothetical protein
MSKKRQQRGGNSRKQTIASPRHGHLVVVLLLTVSALAVMIFLIHHWRSNGAHATVTPAARESAAPPETKPEFEILQGRWQRPDGGYVLEIRDIAASGKMTAAYFNPSPINVSQAQSALDGTTIKVFIELRDANYPGATYHLTHDPERDQLRGVYFQPALQQSFDVFFTRME